MDSSWMMDPLPHEDEFTGFMCPGYTVDHLVQRNIRVRQAFLFESVFYRQWLPSTFPPHRAVPFQEN